MNELNQNQVEVSPPQDFNPFDTELDQAPVTMHFTAWAKKDPNRLALSGDGKVFSYGELNTQANQLANHLLQILGEKEEPIVILIKREPSAVISILATLKAGKFYAGLDAASPEATLRAICDDLGPRVILTNSKYMQIAERISGEGTLVINVEQLEVGLSVNDPAITPSLDLMAGIYYTSGSTGVPKGVMVDHRAMWHRTFSGIMSLKTSPSDHICLPFPISFGWSTSPLFGALVTGASLFLYDFSGKSIIDVADWFVENKITYTPIPSTFFRQFINSMPDGYGMGFPDMRVIFVGGEAMQSQELQLWRKRFSSNCILRYGFSSTEAGPITFSIYTKNQDASETNLTFGIPAPGVEILIRDEQGILQRSGATGEIVINSKGVTKGYWKKDLLNQKIFIIDPEKAENKLYLSGDLGRINENNELEFLGRKDTQVKIRGYRVDLLNIETIIRKLSAVQDVTVTPYKGSNGDTRLVAYLVLNPNEITTTQKIRKQLATQLTAYMMPSSFCVVDTLPYNATGKVIAHALPKPSRERPEVDSIYIPPTSELDVQVAKVWQRILDLDEVGIDDNFFELGGDSLMALEMILEVEKTISRTIISQSFFKHPTISNLTTQLKAPELKKTNTETFVLQSDKKHRHLPKTKKTRSFGTEKIKKLVGKKYSLNSIDRLVDMLVAKYISTQSYEDAKVWITNWSQNSLIQNMFYQRRYTLFSKWMMELENCHIQPSNAFPISMATNLSYGLAKYIGKNRKRGADKGSRLDAIMRSPSRYWRSLAELISATPLEQLNENFPVNGLDHLLNAHKEGNGVILLSFHGVMTPTRFLTLEQRIGMKIFTISYRIPLEQSRHNKNPKELTNSIGSTMNAEVALFGQRQLQQGGIVNIVGDTSDPYGQAHQITLGGRAYRIKSGFAELALNTGAKIIPHFGGSLADGRPELNLLPPLDPGNGSRGEQIEKLVSDYTAFINHVWVTRPEVLRWMKMKKHFSRQMVDK